MQGQTHYKDIELPPIKLEVNSAYLAVLSHRFILQCALLCKQMQAMKQTNKKNKTEKYTW